MLFAFNIVVKESEYNHLTNYTGYIYGNNFEEAVHKLEQYFGDKNITPDDYIASINELYEIEDAPLIIPYDIYNKINSGADYGPNNI